MRINRVGVIGETYTDSDTGKMYECIYSYRDSNGNVDCTWREIGVLPMDKIHEKRAIKPSDDFQTKPEIESEKIPEGKISENNSKSSDTSPNRTNYNKYSKK